VRRRLTKREYLFARSRARLDALTRNDPDLQRDLDILQAIYEDSNRFPAPRATKPDLDQLDRCSFRDSR
jgi:hypothetical protein